MMLPEGVQLPACRTDAAIAAAALARSCTSEVGTLGSCEAAAAAERCPASSAVSSRALYAASKANLRTRFSLASCAVGAPLRRTVQPRGVVGCSKYISVRGPEVVACGGRGAPDALADGELVGKPCREVAEAEFEGAPSKLLV